MASKRRSIQPFHLDAEWTNGARTPAWDSLWRHLCKNVLISDASEENIDDVGLHEELIIDDDEG